MNPDNARLADELEQLRGDSEDSALIAGHKRRLRGAFVDKHFDAILSALRSQVRAVPGGLAIDLHDLISDVYERAYNDGREDAPNQYSGDA